MRAIHPLPSSDPVRVGAKLRETRKAQGLTIEQVAAATDLSKGFLSRVERDDTSPSVATLVLICQVLSLPVGTLFEEPDAAVITLDNAPPINMGGTGVTDRLVTPRFQSRVQILHSEIEPHATGGDELYTINCDVEVVHVIGGRLVVRLGGETLTLDSGDTLTLGGREPHTWYNPADEPARVIWVITPAAWSGSA